MNWTWVEDRETLTALVSQLAEREFVALDTEFVRETTYFARLGLIQMATPEHGWLIDPLACADGLAECLRPLLLAPHCLKVLHAADEDLEIFADLLGEPVFPVLDTQLAETVLGGPEKQGYAGMVEQYLGVHVAKGATRSNWLARPLSPEQCQYAVADVAYLAQLVEPVRQRLADRQRWHWVAEDMARVARRSLEKRDDEAYLLLRQGWQLRGNRLWLLQQLAAQREVIARSANRVRRHVLSDQDLVRVATSRPARRADLQQITSMSPAAIRRESHWLLSLVQASHTVPASAYPPPVPGPLSRAEQAGFKTLRSRVRAAAADLGVPPTLLARKRELEALVAGAGVEPWRWPDTWSGWRAGILARVVDEWTQQQKEIPDAGT